MCLPLTDHDATYSLVMTLLFQCNHIVRRYYTLTIIIIIIIITSSSDLQPSTALVNQLPGQLVYTQIRTTRPNCFKFIIAFIMTSTNIV